MKKLLPIIIVGVVVAGLGIGGWIFLKSGKGVPVVTQPTEEVVVQETPATQEEEKGFTGKLEDALTLGKAMKCTWEEDEDNFGTAYIKDENVHTDVTYEGTRSHTLIVDNCTYTWEEEKTDGLKICYEPEEGEEDKAVSEGPTTIEAPDINYHCLPAVVSDSMFNPPANISFVSLEEMMGF